MSNQNLDMMEALETLAADRGISIDVLLGALADAMESAYRKSLGDDAHEYWATIDRQSLTISVSAQELDEDLQPIGPELDVTPPQDSWGASPPRRSAR